VWVSPEKGFLTRGVSFPVLAIANRIIRVVKAYARLFNGCVGEPVIAYEKLYLCIRLVEVG
jgi:hypothetical protein